jgi:hypothetical protein
MTISDEISIIANQLANQGRTPSVALIKGKLSQPTPLPKIISVLKSWQHEPNFIKLPSQEKETTTESITSSGNEELSRLLSQAMLPLEQELAEIKTLLEKLTSKQ